MAGPISYCLEREPDFFALTRLQGDAGGRIAVIDDGDEVVAMAMIATYRAWIDGQPQTVAYLGDLKTDPDHRHKGFAGRIIRFLACELDRLGIEHSYFLALAGNPAFDNVGTSPDQFDARRIRSICNYLVPFGSLRSSSSEIVTRRATADDTAEMIALWNRVNARRMFAPVLDDSLFARWIGDFILARRNGSIVGFCAAWDASAIKQIRLLRLSRGLAAFTKLYNVAARFMRRPRFPPVRECLSFLYVAHVCAEDPAVLGSMLDAVHDEHRTDGYLYFDIALDRTDPLSDALRGFRSMKVEFEIWQAVTPGRRTSGRLSSTDCAYFDVSLV